ncbi:oligo-1,6-glucosidase [Granulicella rosea]|uniref:Oligo-1,6-glucosidase n=1 Tax=Granulicella rosea TaxID=474952 RepID=A0A239E5M5_9BACT|nr:TonB family protein [Granulicella rosea]SNS39598.1 oligo-1,6-glucosidase [Granulicella rosea]
MRMSLLAGVVLSSVVLPVANAALLPALLQAHLTSPSATAASNATAATAATSNLRISTGVTAPVVISTTDVRYMPHALDTIPADSKVELSLQVDEKGLPKDIKVVKSVNPSVDESVVAAVSAYRFRPATLDNQPVAIQVKLNVVLAR